MDPVLALIIFAVAAFAGCLGSMLGVGGGIIIVPALTMLFRMDFREAVASSLLCVVATSIAGTVAYLRRRYTDLHVGLLLVFPSVLGAIIGSFFAPYVPSSILRLLFSMLLIYTAYAMWQNLRKPAGGGAAVPADADGGFSVPGSFVDDATGKLVEYRARHFGWGLSASSFAGIISGLLGVGGGVIQVPVMRLKMGVPLKVATATSTFMIGITTTTSVMAYFHRGQLDLPVTALTALGILLGATIGPRIAAKVKTRFLQYFFILFLLATTIQMIVRSISDMMGGAQ